MCRKRNVSDGDSGFDSALSSRSNSISLDPEESPEFGKQFFSPGVDVDLFSSKLAYSSLREQFQDILTVDEHIERKDEIYLITNKVTGAEIAYFKPPTKLKFSSLSPEVATTHSPQDYDRNNSIPRSALFHARLEYELEKQIAKMDLVEVDLVMENGVIPPPSLGIRVIGVNMIHGVPDKLNIYVKRIVDDSVAGRDGRIFVNDHIVEVNGISLVGVSQKLAAQTLSNCAICPETGKVHFVLARPPKDAVESSEEKQDDAPSITAEADVLGKSDVRDEQETVAKSVAKVKDPFGEGSSSDDKNFTQAPDSFLKAQAEPEFVGRDAVRLTQQIENEERSGDNSEVGRKVETLRERLRLSKLTVLVTSFTLVFAILTVAETPKRKMT